MMVSEKKVKSFIYQRYRTFESLLEEFGDRHIFKIIDKLLKKGEIKKHFVYLKGWRFILTKPDFDINKFLSRKNKWRKILEERYKAKKKNES